MREEDFNRAICCLCNNLNDARLDAVARELKGDFFKLVSVAMRDDYDLEFHARLNKVRPYMLEILTLDDESIFLKPLKPLPDITGKTVYDFCTDEKYIEANISIPEEEHIEYVRTCPLIIAEDLIDFARYTNDLRLECNVSIKYYNVLV